MAGEKRAREDSSLGEEQDVQAKEAGHHDDTATTAPAASSDNTASGIAMPSQPKTEAEAAAAAAPAQKVGFVPPPEAGAVQYAELWYFIDNHGVEQGPHAAATMRAWFEGGYFPVTCQVAASYYGEVPEKFWPISALWAEPNADAFVIIVMAPVEEPPDIRPEYMPSDVFTGARDGYCFKSDLYGVGYYLDQPPEIDPKNTWIELEKEKEEREATRRRLNAAVHFSGEGPS